MRPGRIRLTVQAWFLLALAALAIVMCVSAVIGYQRLQHTDEVSDRLLNQVNPARVEAYRLQASLLDQETGVRGYVIAGDSQFLEPYARGRSGEKAAEANMQRLIGGEPELAADLKAIRQAAASWRQDYTTDLIARTKASGPRPVDQTTAEQSKRAFDHIRKLSNTQLRHLDRTRDQALADLHHTRALRDGTFAGVLAAFLLTGVVLAILVHVVVVRPLQRLRDAARLVSGGDFQHRIPSHGPADVRSVASDVEAMRRRIVAELDDSLAKEALLHQQAEERELQAAELWRSNAELEQFAYVASHDLQEPLRKVVSFCQLLEKRYGKQLDERGAQYIGFAVDGAKRMQVLINDLLTFSRVGRVEEDRATFPLDQPLEQALSNLSTVIEESGATIERPESLPEITGEPTRLSMLRQNLIGNAIKFHKRGVAPVVRIEAEGPDEEGVWRFSVADNGIGIPAEFADKVFIIFQRLHSRDSYGGTGIGLALCKKIVEYHGGRIWLDSSYTSGTRISFTLPAAAVPAGATATLSEGLVP